jgi:DNA-binding CsgD family transcriptional regulator
MSIKSPNNLLALGYNITHLNELTAICDPLFKLSANTIKAFSYHCFFPDQTHFSIGTNIAWMEFYLLEAHNSGDIFQSAIRQTPYNAYKYFLWPSHHKDDHVFLFLHYHNISNGFSVLQRNAHFVEMWSFSSTSENEHINNFYINNLDEIKYFIKFFRYKASKLVDLSKEVPLAVFKKYNDISYSMGQDIIEQSAKEIFTREASAKKVIITIPFKEKIILTRREHECLLEISKGKSYKEVAHVLSLKSKEIKERTVESYINNIKDKFMVNNRYDLINNYHKILL